MYTEGYYYLEHARAIEMFLCYGGTGPHSISLSFFTIFSTALSCASWPVFSQIEFNSSCTFWRLTNLPKPFIAMMKCYE
eukprot:SAG11_NODE_1836_length_4187_cov_69.990460_1_plen_78_part_10